MIEEVQRPVWIPWNDEARDLIFRARRVLNEGGLAVPPRDLLRRLQSYAVGTHGLDRLKDFVVPVDPEGRFHELVDLDSLYDKYTGLRLDKGGLRDPQLNIF